MLGQYAWSNLGAPKENYQLLNGIRIPFVASINISNINSHAMLPSQIVVPYDCTGSSYVGYRCPRSSEAKPQVYVVVLHSAQVEQYISDYLQHQTAESVRNG